MKDGKARILTVDDDESMREMVQFFLRTQGYETRGAESGEKALELVQW